MSDDQESEIILGLRTNEPSNQVSATLLSCLQASLEPVLGETRDSMRAFLNATRELMQEVRGPSQSPPWPGSLKGHPTGSLPFFRLQCVVVLCIPEAGRVNCELEAVLGYRVRQYLNQSTKQTEGLAM